MLNIEQWRHAHQLWDGIAKNMNEVCGTCGACCNMTEKLLFPGEEAYLKDEAFKNTGTVIDNPAWLFDHCACSKYQAKPVICKLYPLDIQVDRTGYQVHFRKEEYSNHYSGRCRQLEIDSEKALEFFDFIFSDFENRLWWFYHDTLNYIAPEAKKQVKKEHEISFRLEEVEWHLFEVAMLGYEKNQNLYHYVYCKDREDGRELPLLYADYVTAKGK